jgi:tellurite resistance protein
MSQGVVGVPHIMEQYIRNIPVTLFTIVMGIGGLSIAYQRFAGIIDLPLIGIALLLVAYAIFIGVSLLYMIKLLFYRSEVSAEFNDPVKAYFFAAISISILVLSIATFDHQRPISFVLWGVGTALQLLILLVIASRWITRDHEITHVNPAWFLPAAGNFLVPMAGADFVGSDLSWFFFTIGLFFWIVLFIIIFYRITFHRQMAEKLTPTLFILIAPPALGFISYVKLTGTFDIIARLLLNVALFMLLLLLFMLPHFLKVRYSISWWAYTFPLCIATTATVLAYRMTGTTGFVWISMLLLFISSLAVVIVFVRTLAAIKNKSIFEPG